MITSLRLLLDGGGIAIDDVEEEVRRVVVRLALVSVLREVVQSVLTGSVINHVTQRQQRETVKQLED